MYILDAVLNNPLGRAAIIAAAMIVVLIPALIGLKRGKKDEYDEYSEAESGSTLASNAEDNESLVGIGALAPDSAVLEDRRVDMERLSHAAHAHANAKYGTEK